MAFPYNASGTNQALGKMGSSYMVEDPTSGMSAPPISAPSAPVAPPAVTQTASPVSVPTSTAPVASVAPVASKGADVAGGLSDAAGYADAGASLAGMVGGSDDGGVMGKTLKKAGALAGMVASMYTDNVGGMAASAKGLTGE